MDGRAKRRFWSLPTVFIVALFASLVACDAASTNDASSEEVLAPTTRDGHISSTFALLLENRHVSKRKIDAEISHRAFELFFKAIDPTKLYFTSQDVEEFSKAYYETMASEAKKRNLKPAFEIYERFLQRVDERCAVAQKLLDENNFDFSVDEEFIRDKAIATYPSSDEEAYDRMRKRVKFEILSIEAENRDKDKHKNAEEKQENAEEKQENVEQKQENDEHDGDDANANDSEQNAAPVRADDPISKLKRRYSTLQKRLHQTSNDDLLEIYLTAIGNAFDPHTTYMSPKSYENFMIQIGLNLEGIGATLQWDDGYTIVKRIVKGSPAEKQGELQVEDKIVGVGQGEEGPIEDVVDMKLTDVVDKIRGKGGTIVRLEVVSQDGKKKSIKIKREKVDLEDSAAQAAVFALTPKPDGAGFDVDDVTNADAPTGAFKVGVIDLPSFYLDMKSKGSAEGRSVSTDVRAILNDFNAKGVDVCVVDLRYNGGGSLPEAVKLTGLFIKTGAVVQTKPTELGDFPRSLNDPDPAIVWSKPLVVMTSRLSASASEIFAGAIRDYKRGVIVGDETTHGKGSVQSMQEISESLGLFAALRANQPNMGAIKITIQGYYLPAGESPQLKGVRSDVVLPQLTSALEDIAESDLDYPLEFERVNPSKYPNFEAVNPEIVAALAEASKKRVDESKEFQEEVEKIEMYRDSKLRKAIPLNRDKYFAELDKLNANKEETDKMEEIVNGDGGVKRDYYLDEVMFIARDYAQIIRALIAR